MHRSYKHLYDLLKAGEEIQGLVADATLDDYRSSRILQLAVERCLITMGEAATVVLRDTPELAEQFPELPEIKGLRNRVVHDYDNINDVIVWGSVRSVLPEFLIRLRAFVDAVL
jgi:uncharacterized protein with HEPN domain